MTSLQEANSIYRVRTPDGSFQFLLSQLIRMCRIGRTTDTAAFDRYVSRKGVLALPPRGDLFEFG